MVNDLSQKLLHHTKYKPELLRSIIAVDFPCCGGGLGTLPFKQSLTLFQTLNCAVHTIKEPALLITPKRFLLCKQSM